MRTRTNGMTADMAVLILMVGIWAAFGIGWVMNIVKFVSHFYDPLTALEVLRGIGILAAPLGTVLGYFF